jgi:hypothetical protein
LRPGALAPAGQGVVGADLGYMKFGIFPGDSGIFSITLAAALDDDPLRAILHEGPFEAAARALPATREWIDPARSEPVTDVRAMAKLVNRRRRFVRDGEPLALGVFAIGDAAICSNRSTARLRRLRAPGSSKTRCARTRRPARPALALRRDAPRDRAVVPRGARSDASRARSRPRRRGRVDLSAQPAPSIPKFLASSRDG